MGSVTPDAGAGAGAVPSATPDCAAASIVLSLLTSRSKTSVGKASCCLRFPAPLRGEHGLERWIKGNLLPFAGPTEV